MIIRQLKLQLKRLHLPFLCTPFPFIHDLYPSVCRNRVDVRKIDTLDANYRVKEISEDREYDYYLNICEPLVNSEKANLSSNAMMVQVLLVLYFFQAFFL